MDSDDTTGVQGDRPQWLGSLVRRGDQHVQATTALAGDEYAGARWLGSVARRPADGGATREHQPSSASDAAAATWRGSSARSAVFSAPRVVSACDPLPGSAPALHELNGHGRMVMGELGMTLRVAA